jgi:uncharacterized protein (DUF983 family)
MENISSVSKKRNSLSAMLAEKCPNCGRGHVFERSKHVFEMPVMKNKCENCNYTFDREPGYFIGALYISYGLAVAQAILTFVLCYFLFPAMETVWIPIIILGVLCALAKKNYKLSRIIYIHIFPW